MGAHHLKKILIPCDFSHSLRSREKRHMSKIITFRIRIEMYYKLQIKFIYHCILKLYSE